MGLEALAAETKMLNLTPAIRHAWNRLATLVQEGKHGKDIDEPLFFADAQDAAYTFADDAFWVRPYVDSFAFSDHWFPNLGRPPVVSYAGASFVYDPQVSLPAFVQAISIFTAIAGIFHADANDAPTLQPYFTDFATLLDRYYTKVTDGLVMVPIPPRTELRLDVDLFKWEGPYFTNRNYSFGSWTGEIGVVDIYCVFSEFGASPGSPGFASAINIWPGAVVDQTNLGNIIAPYPELSTRLSYVSDDPFTPQHLYRWFHIRVVIGALARYKALYIAKGYDRVWSLVQKLRFLGSGKPGTIEYNFPAAPPPAATDRKAHWCLSEFDRIISQDDGTLQGNPFTYEFSHAGNPITAQDIISKLHAVVETSKTWTYEPNMPVQTPQRPLSLRAAIAAVAV